MTDEKSLLISARNKLLPYGPRQLTVAEARVARRAIVEKLRRHHPGSNTVEVKGHTLPSGDIGIGVDD